MSVNYIRLFGMCKVRIWTGNPKPDAPNLGLSENSEELESKIYAEAENKIEEENAKIFSFERNEVSILNYS